MKQVIQVILMVGVLSGCAYYEQIIGNASTYYDAKVEAWFTLSCALNQGALGRISEHRRSIVEAACPPRKQIDVKSNDNK